MCGSWCILHAYIPPSPQELLYLSEFVRTHHTPCLLAACNALQSLWQLTGNMAGSARELDPTSLSVTCYFIIYWALHQSLYLIRCWRPFVLILPCLSGRCLVCCNLIVLFFLLVCRRKT